MSKHTIGTRKKASPTMAERADRHVLYEATVQGVEAEIDFVDNEFRRLTGRRAHHLREDFCGTANTACEWVRRRRDNVAIGVDLDAEVLAWARENKLSEMRPAQRARIDLVESDVNAVRSPLQDVVLAMNCSYWTLAERRNLRNYFRKVRSSLVEDGVFFLDCFGGYDAIRVGRERRRYDGYTYVWETAGYNALNGRLTCHIHFRFDDGSRLAKAFTYEWRLWTLPEIRELLHEAGFGKVVVYSEGWDEEAQDGDGNFVPVEEVDPDAGWVCYISAQTA